MRRWTFLAHHEIRPTVFLDRSNGRERNLPPVRCLDLRGTNTCRQTPPSVAAPSETGSLLPGAGTHCRRIGEQLANDIETAGTAADDHMVDDRSRASLRLDDLAQPVTDAAQPGDVERDRAVGILRHKRLQARPCNARDCRASESTMTATASTAPVIMKRSEDDRFNSVSPLAID